MIEELVILTQIIFIDIILAADNAIIIGMLASKFDSFTQSYYEIHDDKKTAMNAQQLFTLDELHEFYISLFTHRNQQNSLFSSSKGMKLRELSSSGGTKSLEFVATSIFWKDNAFAEYHKNINGRSTCAITPNHKAVQHFLNKIGGKKPGYGDRLLKQQAYRQVSF